MFVVSPIVAQSFYDTIPSDRTTNAAKHVYV